jgi:hypothetical protein
MLSVVCNSHLKLDLLSFEVLFSKINSSEKREKDDARHSNPVHSSKILDQHPG